MISVIIPTLNEEGFLPEALGALQSLLGKGLEIIVSDGRSKDATLDIARRFGARAVVYEGMERQTIAHARNLGARAAQGEYLVFMDADVMIPDVKIFFAKLVQRFEDDQELNGLTVSIQVSPKYRFIRDIFFCAFMNGIQEFKNNTLNIGSASGEFQMMKRSAFEEVGGFNDALVAYEDFDLFERLAKIGKTRMFPEHTVFHSGRRIHKVGYIKLLCIWMLNGVWFFCFDRAYTKEWKPVR